MSTSSLVQRKSNGDASAEGPHGVDPVATAQRGTSGTGGPLPHLDQIQRSFGHHDVSGVRAHQGGKAEAAAGELGASAYAIGDAVAFRGPPDLHTAAHEAAHVIQQRGGVQLKGEIDTGIGDPFEQHADAVADTVVRGESAATLLDAMVGSSGSAPAVQRKGGDGDHRHEKKDALKAPDLKGAPYQWVSGTFNLWVSRDWFTSASDFSESGGQWIAPSRIREMLTVLREKGMLTWASPDRINKAAGELAIPAGRANVTLIRLDTSAFNELGLPPGTEAIVGKRSDRGLDVVVSIENARVAEGKEFPLSLPHKQQIIKALEGYTRLPILPGPKQQLLDRHVTARLGAGTSFFTLHEDYCDELFGKEEYTKWFDAPQASSSHFQFDIAAGNESYGDLTPDEVVYVRDWLKSHLHQVPGKGRPVAMSRLLLETLHKIDDLPKDRRDRVIAMLHGKDHGEEGQLTAAVLERIMQQAKFDEEREKAGFKPNKDGKKERPPVFDYPIPARIDQRNGLILSGESVEFTLAIDWPTAYTADQQSEYTWRPMVATVDWLFERTVAKGKQEERAHSSIGFKHDGHASHRFKLEQGEDEAVWTVHAFVHHNFFQPNHLLTQVEVKTEEKRLQEMRKQSFAQLGDPAITDDDYDFDTSQFNEWFGDRKYDHGKQFRGELPKDFKRRTPEQRKESLEGEIRQNEQLLEYLRKEGTQPDAVTACEHYIAKLRDAASSMDDDVKDGWQPFEIRGFFLGRGNHIADGPLDLYGTVRRITIPTPDGRKVELVEVAIRDLSRRLDADNYRFTGSAATFEPALEEAFIDLCKKYPGGKVSIAAEGFEQDGKKPTGRTVGFELDTGSEWKDVKSKVFDPVVNVAVNVASAVVMIVFPATIPVLLPVTIAYNETQNVDQMIDEIDSGTFTAKKGALHLGQFALDVLPLVGRAPIIRGSRAAFAMFEVANFAGQAILMKEQVQETIRQIRDTQIKDMADLYARYVELEKTTQASDPNLAKMRAELDKRGQEIREAAIKAWEEAAVNFAIVAVPSHVAQAINVHVTTGRAAKLQEAGRLVHVDNVEPHYDPKRGQIVGDQSKLDRPMLDRLTKEQDAHLRGVSARLAGEIGVPAERVVMKPAGEGEPNRIWRDGDEIQVRYQPGTDPEVAIGIWKTEAKKARIGKPSKGHHTGTDHGRPTHEPPPTERPRTSADHEVVSETSKIDRQLAEGTGSQAKETTAAAVPGSSFRGGEHLADSAAVLTESRAAFETAAKRFGDVSSVEKVSTKHLDPSRQKDEIARLDDTYLVTTADGSKFTIRITSGPLGSDAVARTVVNPTKQGASFVERPGEPNPVKEEVKGRYVIQLNETIDPAHAERAIAHEVGEILAERELAEAKTPPGPDLLKQGTAPESGALLSPHDRGRIGEIKVLAAKVNAGDGVATREMMALVEELGIRDGMAGAPERQHLVRQALKDDPVAIAALERTSRDAATLEPDLKNQLDSIRSGREQHLAEAEARKAAQPQVHDLPDAAPAPGKLVSPEHARELALQAAQARATRSHETLQRLRAEAAHLPTGEYPKIGDVQIGGGAGLAARDKQALLIDARGRWQADASDRIAQTANQLRGLKDAGIGDPFQFAAPNERVPMSAVRYWEDSIAAQGPVIDGHVTGIAIDEHGRTIVTIQPSEGGKPIKVQVDGNVAMSTGFPVERIPGTPRGQTPDKAIDQIKGALEELITSDPARRAHAQKALHEIENISGLEMQPGQRESDLAAAKHALKKHGLEHAIEGKVKDAYDMMVAGDQWNRLREQHPDKVVLGDMANLESLDANVTDKWIIGGPGGTGISAAEIVLAKNSKAHVSMVGKEPPAGLIENDQFLEVLKAHADAQTAALYEQLGGVKIPPGDGRFSLVLGVDVQPPSMDRHGNVHARGKDLPANFVPEGYSAANNPLTGGGYISSIGRESQLPPIAAAFKDSVEAQGGRVTMAPNFSEQTGHYLGYELIAKDKNGVEQRRIDVTGAASRFPPWELMDRPPAEVAAARNQFRRASDFDAPPESGNFDGGFVASATQASRYARELEAEKQKKAGSPP